MIPSRFTGDDYATIVDAQMRILGDANGLRPIAAPAPPLDGGFVAALSNGQAVALVQAWRHAAARGKVKWSLWPDLEAYALGQRQPSDRFDMSAAHRKAAFPDEGLTLLWSTISQLALDLDASSTVVRPVDVEWTTAAYEQGARDTWEWIKDQVGKVSAPPKPPLPQLPDKPPPGSGDLVDVVTDPLKPVRRTAGWVLFAAFCLGVYVVTKD